MAMRFRLRLLFVAVLSALLSVALVAPAEARPRSDYPDRIELPVGFQPEGITIGKAPYAYVGSLANGAIYRADLRTGRGRVITPKPPGTPAVGLKIDNRGRLYVAGGPSGTARVVSARTGKILATYTLSTKPSFINDVVLTKRAAWFTNSQQPELYRVSRDGRGPRVTTLPLSGDWRQVPNAFNANGIALTPDGRALLVVQSATGFLFRVDPATGVARRVNLGGYLLTNGDGLLVRGDTLYVVQNRLEQVAVFDLNRRGTAGTLEEVLPVPDSDVPTTVAAYRGSLYLPNARFGNPTPATADYWITRIDK
jgi:sugar lactone lactonase YvrE